MPIHASMPGGVQHGLTALSHSERQAALNAISKIKGTAGRLGSSLAGVKQSATLLGGSAHKPALSSSTLIHGSGSDTFIGGARGSMTTSIGNDTVLSGSAKPVERGAHASAVPGTHNLGHAGLSTDTINIAGTTAASVKSMHPDDKAKAHTVTLGDKTKVTISGLSSHDISKLHH
jgi:hypothetical protein